MEYDRGFGFLRDSEGISRFFEAREVKPLVDFDRLREGDIVEFIPTKANVQKGNGLRAAEVRKCDS